MLDESAVTAGDLMTRDVVVVHPETTLLAAVKLMAGRRISGLPIVDGVGNLLGMLSEGDLLRWHEGYGERQMHFLDMLADGYVLAPDFLGVIRAEGNKVKTVMTSDAVTVTEDVPAREIAHLMHVRDIKRVPVVRDGKLVGIVARSDLVRALAEKLSEEPSGRASTPSTVNEALRRARETRGDR